MNTELCIQYVYPKCRIGVDLIIYGDGRIDWMEYTPKSPEELQALEPYALLWQQEQSAIASSKVAWKDNPEMVGVIKTILETVKSEASVDDVIAKAQVTANAELAVKLAPITAAKEALPLEAVAVQTALDARDARIAEEIRVKEKQRIAEEARIAEEQALAKAQMEQWMKENNIPITEQPIEKP
jgi:hypothetical protein